MTAAIDPSVYTDLQGLAQLRRQARAEGGGHSPETLRKVAGQFEALFVQQMLKTMRESSLGEGLMDSEQTKFYQGMFDQQISLEMTRGQGLGLAAMLVRQLGGETAAESRPTPQLQNPFTRKADRIERTPAEPSTSSRIPGPDPMAFDPASRGTWRATSREAFVADLLPHAEQAAARLGVDARVLIAQAALETGWGQSVMQRKDGRSSHNLFGIKADARWHGEQVGHRTVEFRHGVLTQEQASFRAYASPAHSLSDYAEFIAGNPRYQHALGAIDPQRYAAELQRAGYATDPEYARKIMSIFQSEPFQSAMAQAQLRARDAATDSKEAPVMSTVTPSDATRARAGEV